MIKTFADALMSADAVCGAGNGQRSTERTNTHNGYRRRGWDTGAGLIELAIPRLEEGSCFPEWLLERRRRAESALISVVLEAKAGCATSPMPHPNRGGDHYRHHRMRFQPRSHAET
jgi:transposase-like protein